VIAFDTTFLVDYLDGEAATETFLDAHRDKPLVAPSLSLFEVYRGAARVGGDDAVERVQSGLDWLQPLPLSAATAREAALIETDLLDAGTRINLGDVLIAGICRHNGARIVTRDDHFDRVDGLETLRY